MCLTVRVFVPLSSRRAGLVLTLLPNTSHLYVPRLFFLYREGLVGSQSHRCYNSGNRRNVSAALSHLKMTQS